jgi:Zn-dependent protease
MVYDLAWLIDASAWVIPVLLAVTLHEAAHGLMALRFGDDTAKRLGRVSFNPVRHIDRWGTLVFPGMLLLLQSKFLFGYAKPVPVSFANLQPPRFGMVMVALAGPMANILLGFISGLLLHIDLLVTPEQAPWLYLNLYRGLMINCVLAVFNLIPILPLDGGRVIDAMLTGRAKEYFGRLERYGVWVVLAILLVPPFFGYNGIMEAISAPTYWLLRQLIWLSGNSNV